MLLLADVADVFENVCQESNVCPDIEAMTVSQRLESECVPNFVRVLEILVRDVLARKITEELFFGWEARFVELSS